MTTSKIAPQDAKFNSQMTIDDVLARLGIKAESGRTQYKAHCPAHPDDKPSLSITLKPDGMILWKCHAGCSQEDVGRALGILNGQPSSAPPHSIPKSASKPRASKDAKVVAVYQYLDEKGALLFEVVRKDDKTFPQRRPDGKNGYIWKLDGVRRVLYRLPELIAADPGEFVFIAEGEKDVDNLRAGGLVATTNPGGAGSEENNFNWLESYSEVLQGRRICILPDNDEKGRKHAQQVAASLHGKAADVRILELSGLPAKGDVSDWLGVEGNGPALLYAMAEGARPYIPPPAPSIEEDSPQRQTRWQAGELLRAVFTDPVWFVPGLVPAGLTILAGRPKIGKSWLALQIAIAIATGGVVLGRKVERRKVLYIALEDGPRRLKDRMTKLGCPDDANLEVWTEIPRLLDGGLNVIFDEIEQNGVQFVVIDTLARWAPARPEDESANAVHLGMLQHYLIHHDIGTLIVDHHRKAAVGGVGDVVDDVIGATAKTGTLDAVLGIFRDRGQKDATLKATGRDQEDAELIIAFDPQLSCWQLVGNANEVIASRVQQEILDAIEENYGGSATCKQLADFMGKMKQNVHRELQDLVGRGRLVRAEKNGREVAYRLPGAGANVDDDD